MRTINGKLISHEEAKSLDFKTKLKDIQINIEKLELVLKENNQQIITILMGLKYLEQKINSLDKLEQKVNKIFIIIMIISVVGIGSLTTVFFQKKQPSPSSPKKHAELIQLIDQYFI